MYIYQRKMYKNTLVLYIYTIICILYTPPFMAVGLEAVTAVIRAVRAEVSVNQMVGLVAVAGAVGRGYGRRAIRRTCAKLCNIQ